MIEDKAALEKANAAARRIEHLRDGILLAITITVVAIIVAGACWLFLG